MIIRSKHNGYTRDGVRLYPGGGSPGAQTSTGTTYTSNIPEYAQQPFMNLVGKSEALSSTPYQPFTGQRIEGFTPLQQQAQTSAANQGVAPQIGAASGLAGGAATASFTQPGIAGAYMSPYMQSVVEAQQRDASRQAGIAGTQRAAEFTKAGAFGGSRQAIMDAEAARNLALQQGDIQAKGLQSAFEAGQGQFNNEMNRGLAGAQTLGQLGQQQFGQQMDITGLQNEMGGQQQQLNQRQLDQQYADFQQQRDYPYQQLGFLSDILRGVSGSTRTMYSSQPQAGGLQNLAGLGALAGAFYRGGTVRFAKGGLVSAYAAGGVVEPLALPARLRTMSDQQLQEFTKQYGEDLFSMALAKSEADARARMRQAGNPAQAPQGTVMDEVAAEMDPMTQGGIAAAAPDVDFAEGGLIPYADYGPNMADWKRTLAQGREQRDAEADARRAEEEAAYAAGEVPSTSPLRFLDPRTWGEAARGGKSIDEYYGEKTPAVDDRPRLTNPGYRPAQSTMLAAPEKGLPGALPAVETATAPSGRSGAAGASAASSTGTRGGLAGAPAFDPDALIKGVRKEAADLEGIERDALNADAADFEKFNASKGKAGAAQEERIKAQQANLAGAEDKARKAAFLQAGLAILTADPSRGGLAAIAEGAGKGVAQYRGDTEKLEAKREVLLGKLDEIDELRRQEANATEKERMAIRSKIRGLRGDAVRRQMEISKDIGVPLTTAAAKMSQDRYLAERDNATKLQAARISASSGSNSPADRAQRDADAAFARSPEVAMLKEQMKSPLVQMDPIKQREIVNKLTRIQNDTYRQYGVRMVAPSGAPAGPTANDPLGIRSSP